VQDAAILAASYEHLIRLSDDTGLLEHALGAVPRRGCGYCLDDNARALVVVSRAVSAPAAIASLGERYLAFIAHAQETDGACHNRLSYDRRWEDEATTGDWWGRGLWGLGVAAAHHPDGWIREGALTCFEISAMRRSPYTRSMAFASLGAAEILRAYPDNSPAFDLLITVAKQAGRPGEDRAWPWPEARLSYANAVLPEALIATGRALGDLQLQHDGLVLLEWLLATETLDGHLSPSPVGGRSAGDRPRGGGVAGRAPAFDQQPIEAAALADACAQAFQLTGDSRWADGALLAVGWFLGDNDSGVAMYDPESGGGYDGLEPAGCNTNQGAESTLAFISTMQQAQQLGLDLP
jgi:hypothetical protein